jgi:hypothetical protein
LGSWATSRRQQSLGGGAVGCQSATLPQRVSMWGRGKQKRFYTTRCPLLPLAGWHVALASSELQKQQHREEARPYKDGKEECCLLWMIPAYLLPCWKMSPFPCTKRISYFRAHGSSSGFSLGRGTQSWRSGAYPTSACAEAEDRRRRTLSSACSTHPASVPPAPVGAPHDHTAFAFHLAATASTSFLLPVATAEAQVSACRHPQQR